MSNAIKFLVFFIIFSNLSAFHYVSATKRTFLVFFAKRWWKFCTFATKLNHQ